MDLILSKSRLLNAFGLMLIASLFLFTLGCGPDGSDSDEPQPGVDKSKYIGKFDIDGKDEIISLNCGEYAKIVAKDESKQVKIVLKTDCHENPGCGRIFRGDNGLIGIMRPPDLKEQWSDIVEYEINEESEKKEKIITKKWKGFVYIAHLNNEEGLLVSCGREPKADKDKGKCEVKVIPNRSTSKKKSFGVYDNFPVMGEEAYIGCDTESKVLSLGPNVKTPKDFLVGITCSGCIESGGSGGARPKQPIVKIIERRGNTEKARPDVKWNKIHDEYETTNTSKIGPGQDLVLNCPGNKNVQDKCEYEIRLP